ncbi:MAG: hypothetical protein Kow0079_13060 [Vicingaceae bacterium]
MFKPTFYFLLFVFIIGLVSCKKSTIEKIGDSEWEITKYVVNGIASTAIIKADPNYCNFYFDFPNTRKGQQRSIFYPLKCNSENGNGIGSWGYISTNNEYLALGFASNTEFPNIVLKDNKEHEWIITDKKIKRKSGYMHLSLNFNGNHYEMELNKK